MIHYQHQLKETHTESLIRKRENFRLAFDHFDYRIIAGYDEDKIQSLLQDPGIIRNKLKVRASVKNAQAFIKVQKEFGSFSSYIWGIFIFNSIQLNNKFDNWGMTISCCQMKWGASIVIFRIWVVSLP